MLIASSQDKERVGGVVLRVRFPAMSEAGEFMLDGGTSQAVCPDMR